MTWNSTLKRSKSLRAKSDRGQGLGQKVAAHLGFLRPPGMKASTVMRSEKHRRNVASLDCVVCGRFGPSQCAHANFGKGLGLKACDSQTFPACPDCHRFHDSGGISKEARRKLEVVYVDRTRAELIARGLWPADVEEAYKTAYEPMKRAAA
ncbi:hypothetical protein [Achromobacter sp. ACM05]|uniref:hypothetical protein n=1 Tax=Achromobacter sp. ACM05 TaxID=2854776 RepID=UPI0021068F93|nr:hypothetical protein [Achromobacter sp. ACM05]